MSAPATTNISADVSFKGQQKRGQTLSASSNLMLIFSEECLKAYLEIKKIKYKKTLKNVWRLFTDIHRLLLANFFAHSVPTRKPRSSLGIQSKLPKQTSLYLYLDVSPPPPPPEDRSFRVETSCTINFARRRGTLLLCGTLVNNF